MADLTQDVNAEILEERVAVADGLKDSTTLFVKRLVTIRTDAAALEADINTDLNIVLPD